MFPFIVLLFCDVTALYQRVWGAFGFNDLACHNKLSWKQWWKHVMKAVNFAKFAFFFPAGWWDDRSLKLIPQTSVSSPTMVLCCSVGTLKCSTTTSLSSSTSVWAPSLFRWDGQSGWAARLQERRKPGSLLPCSWTHRGCVEMSAYLQQTLSQTAMYTSIASGFLRGGFLFQELLPAARGAASVVLYQGFVKPQGFHVDLLC